MIALLLSLFALQAESPSLRLVHVGRNAVFVDTASVVQEGPRRTGRILRIVPPGEPIAGELYFGGWQKMSVDCARRTFTPISFTSLRESGAVGPEQLDRKGEPHAIAEGSVEDGVRRALCEGAFASEERAASVPDAARVGRERIERHLREMIERGGE